MPRIYKPMFCARKEGWLIGEIDQAQLEFRVAVQLGDDEQGRKDIEEDFDVHSFTASVLNSVDIEWVLANKDSDPVAKGYRQDAKADTFKPLFGGSSGTEKQQEYYTAFKNKYKGIAKTQEGWLYEVLDHKELRLASGLIVYWPDTAVTESGYITNTTQIYNLPIQSFATADIVPIGVVYQWHRMKAEKMESFLVNTIHDSSIGEVHPDEKEQYAKIGRQAFIDDTMRYINLVYGVEFTVQLDADVEFGKHWGEK